MAGETHTWNNPLVRWFDDRLPLLTFLRNHLVIYQAPRNLNMWWSFGFLAGIALMIMVLSGLFLAMNYTPHVDMAFNSVERIMRDVNYGWLIRYVHMTGASMFFLVVYVHLFRGLYYGSYHKPREMIWLMGVLLLFTMVPTAFMGYVLVWGQQSFWAATVITSMFTAVPYVGEALVEWMWGGFSVGNPTLNRFFVLHYLFAFVILGMVFVHLWALHVKKSNNPEGIDLGPEDHIPFHPYYTTKDFLGLGLFMIVFLSFVFFAPNFFTEADNYIPANPLVTPHQIVPEWYLLPFYTILKAVPHKLGGVIAMTAAIAILFLMPWLDRSPARSCRYRPIYRVFFWLFIVDCFVLGYLGAQPPAGIFVDIGRIGSIYYFAHFLVIVPLVSMLETPRPLPDGLSDGAQESETGELSDEREDG